MMFMRVECAYGVQWFATLKDEMSNQRMEAAADSKSCMQQGQQQASSYQQHADTILILLHGQDEICRRGKRCLRDGLDHGSFHSGPATLSWC